MSRTTEHPVEPVKPISMELVFVYKCPFCSRELPMLSPIRPTMIRCDVCNKHFPIVPVDERSVAFIKLMLNNGTAAIDADFI